MKLLSLLLLHKILSKDSEAHRVIKPNNDKIFNSKRDATSSPFHSCTSKNCSLNHLLANLSSDVTIYITDEMVLSSVIQLTHLEDIAIIGYNVPTVQCGYSGGLHIVSCHNVTIKGIIWNGGGTNVSINTTQRIVLYMYNSSNIHIHDCSFQSSLGQSVVLSEVSGSVNINNCNFTHNNHYDSHGTAIHYSSKLNDDIQLVFTISNCVFDYNEGASIVHFYQSDTSQICLSIGSSKFSNNQGVPVFILNEQLYIIGVVLFEENIATSGGGLFVDNRASVIFDESSVVTFSKNAATNQGGAIFVSSQAMISFEQNSTVVFNNNRAGKGGAIFLKRSIVILKLILKLNSMEIQVTMVEV